MLQIQIVNNETGEVTFRDFTDDELAQYEKQKADADKLAAEIAAKQAARETLLDKLGITADEAKLLLG
jgi:phosphopantetheinyl transferase (holo-ACP synthase)